MNRKTVEFSIGSICYTIDNVPYYPEENHGEETVSLGVTIKLEILKELMVENNRKNVDYMLFERLKFNSTD